MENRIQGLYNTSVSNPTESHASNMYFLQVKTSSNKEADAVPLHMVINEQDPQNEQYLIPVLQGKHLQLLIGPRAQATTSNLNNQYYYNTAEPQTINADYQILNNGNVINTNQSTSLEADTQPEPGRSALPCNNEKMNEAITTSNIEQKKKILQKFVHIADRTVPPRAIATLPAALQLRRGAVSPQRPLLARVRFGPVEGIRCDVSSEEAERLKLELTSSPLFLLTTEKGTTYINVSDKGQSNWLSLLQLGDQSTANVWLYQEDHELYAATTKSIPARAPLVLGYSKEYVDAHKLPVEQPVLDLDAELTVKHRQWWCYDCQRSMSSAALLQRHMDVYHMEEKPKPRRYRCLNCTRTFSRLFTLRRHTARHCTKKLKEEKNDDLPTPANGVIDPSKPDDLADLSLTPAEDSRLPSDESLQTLANLDFSTSLFDMSGSCREEDFNPYSLGLKDDIGLVGVDFGMETSSKKEVKTENTETVYLTCRYCRQAVVRGRQRQHVKTCTGRKFHCECGRAFQYRDKLALHIHVDHANLTPEQRKEKSTKQDEMEYKCDACNHRFKNSEKNDVQIINTGNINVVQTSRSPRRGMLVNHLWRVHKTVSTIPLEKKVRHYPCGSCHKLYRTAAKRDHHVRTHHPGSGLSGVGTSIEGGRVACAPAACAACPRQYATRAKLLQHVRHHHPALAPPVKNKISVKREK